MTYGYSADISIDAGRYNAAICEAIQADAKYYDGPDEVKVWLEGAVHIRVSANRLPHLRAGLNSVLRLARAAAGSLESIDYN